MKRLVISLIILTQLSFTSSLLHARPKKALAVSPTPSAIVNLVLEGDFKRAGKMALSLEKQLKKLDVASGKFVLGYVKYKTGKYQDAIDYLKAALGGLPVIPDHVRYFLASSCLKTHSNDCAVKYFGEIVSDYPDSVWKDEAQWGLGQANFESGNYDEALKVLSKISPADSNGLTGAAYNLFKASVLKNLGRKAEAAKLLKTVYFDAESKETMDVALNQLRELNTPQAGDILSYIKTFPARLQLAQQLIRRYRYDEGLKILEGLKKADDSPYMTELLADAYFRARDYEKAKILYQDLTSGKKGSLHYLIRLAKSAARVDDFQTAIDIYKKIIKKHSKGRSNSLYRYKLAFLYMDSHQYSKAARAFRDLIESQYKGHLRKNILWNIGWCYYRLGQFNEAVEYFEKVATGGFGKKWRMRALYWMAKCNEKIGAGEQARSIYHTLLAKNRFGYYGFLAAKNLYGKEAIPNDWIVYLGGDLPLVGDDSNLPAGLDKAKYLSDLGLKNLALMEVQKFDKKNAISQDESISFMKFAEDVGDHRAAFMAAIGGYKDLLYQFPFKKDLRRFVWENWYPKAYFELAETFTRRFDVDDKLVYSIMREESRFQTDAVSKADAIGLMQIIPSTGMRLAKELEFNPFNVEDLYRPEINIRFGIKYLGDLGKMFEGERVYVMASYNAGEKAVSRWVKNSDAKDIEEFIEEIPYDETNDYVKKVLKSYWVYHELY